GTMTDGRHRLVQLHKGPNEIYGVLVGPERVRILDSARQNQGVKVSRTGVGHVAIDVVFLAIRVVIYRLDVTLMIGNQKNVGAGLLERVPRSGELNLLDSVGSEECDFASCQRAGHDDLRVECANGETIKRVRKCARESSCQPPA